METWTGVFRWNFYTPPTLCLQKMELETVLVSINSAVSVFSYTTAIQYFYQEVWIDI